MLRTRSQIISDAVADGRISIMKPAPPPLSENEKLELEIKAVEAKRNAEIAARSGQSHRRCEIEHPRNVLLQQRTQLLELIATGEWHKAELAAWDVQRRAITMPAFGNPGSII